MEPLRLKWRRTWPDKPHDYVCEAPEAHGGQVGRITGEDSVFLGAKRWRWNLYAHVPSRNAILSRMDFADDKNSAARALEAAWFAFIEKRCGSRSLRL